MYCNGNVFFLYCAKSCSVREPRFDCFYQLSAIETNTFYDVFEVHFRAIDAVFMKFWITYMCALTHASLNRKRHF